MKVLFLDFDGVLNSKQHLLAFKDKKIKGADSISDADLFAMKREVAPHNMWVLGYIMSNVPDLKIVISSSWRSYYDLLSFRDLFGIFKLDGDRIIGKTPKKFSSERVHEIRMWLNDEENISHKPIDFVTLDDHIIFTLEDPDKNREFTTDGWTGVTMHDAFKIIKHFNQDFKEPVIMI